MKEKEKDKDDKKLTLQDILDFFDQSVHPRSKEDSDCREFTIINIHGTRIALKTGGHFYYKWTTGKKDFDRIKNECEKVIGEKIPLAPSNRRICLNLDKEDYFELEESPDELIIPADENPEFDDIRRIVRELEKFASKELKREVKNEKNEL